MLDRNQIKIQGVRYGRSLQMLMTSVSMFSVEHSSVAMQLHNSFNLLNALLKETGQFTLGFVDNRTLLNNVLTPEKSLVRLENEFLKRQISAVTFVAGLTLAGYKRALGVLAAPPKIIEEAGGLAPYLERNPLELVRIFPAAKNQSRTESGDTVIETDSESFLLAKAFAEVKPGGGALEGLDHLLDSAAMSALAAGEEGARGSGSGAGSGAGTGTGTGAGTGVGGSGGGASVGAAAPAPGAGNPTDIQSIVERALDSASDSGASRPFEDLAKAIQDLRPEFMLAAFPAERRQQLRNLPPDQMAAEIIEDTAVKWAADRLKSAAEGQDSMVVEEEVVRVLLRSLQVSQSAERMGRKLTEYLRDLPLPKSMTERIHDELRWAGIPGPAKTERLLEHARWDAVQYRRGMEQIKDLVRHGDQDNATRLGLHFFAIFEPPGPQPEELGRIPELLRAMAPVRTVFWEQAGHRILQALQAGVENQFHHLQLVNAAVTLGQTLAIYEDFAQVQMVGAALEKMVKADAERHAACCARALESLLSANPIDRLLELYLHKREDGAFLRSALQLLRWSGSSGIARVFQALEEEKVAANRLALLRLTGRLGPEALALARQQVLSERWYLVRNACKLLLELKDPDILKHIAPALEHPDDRVQKAAVAAVLESRKPGRAPVLAHALPSLHPHIIEEVLGELVFLRDPGTLAGLRRLLTEKMATRPAPLLVRAVQAVAAIHNDDSTQLLADVLMDEKGDGAVRRAALGALRPRPEGRPLLEKFIREQARDHLVRDAEEALRHRAGGR